MKFNKEKCKGFIAGVCVTVILASGFTVFAQTIDVEMHGISIYWDGVKKDLKDVKGRRIEPFIYKGTTYLPVRAMADLLGKEVKWDPSTLSVRIGTEPAANVLALDKIDESKINVKNYISLATGEDAEFRLKDKIIQPQNSIKFFQSYSDITYILDNQYVGLTGKIVMPYQTIGSNKQNELLFYSVADNGDKYLIKEYRVQQTEEPIDISIDLRGVTNLQIEACNNEIEYTSPLGDVVFYDANLIRK